MAHARRSIVSAVVIAGMATVLGLLSAPALAVVPHDGYGFGITDPDPRVMRSMGSQFAGLRSGTFRLLLPYDLMDDHKLVAQTVRRMQVAEAAGVDEILVSFGPGRTWRPGDSPPPRGEWAAKVREFVEAYDARVDVWGPANEPNEGVGWLKDEDGVRKLAGYYAELYKLIKRERAGSGDKLLSPEFHDHLDRSGSPIPAGSPYPPEYSTLDRYIDLYEAYIDGEGVGDGFGDFVGWHPYKGLRLQSRAGTDDLAAALPAATPIWITEVGSVRHVAFDTTVINQSPAEQRSDLEWLVGSSSGIANHPRVARIYYWHMRDHNPNWDTALVGDNGAKRGAWYVWCSAIRGSHDTCTGVTEGSIAATSLGWERLDLLGTLR
jgi:hypothetical protein